MANPTSSEAKTVPTFKRGGFEDAGNTEVAFENQTGNLNTKMVQELICQALETEVGGVQIYQTALRCAKNEELKTEWEKYLDETQNHERILREVCAKIALDP